MRFLLTFSLTALFLVSCSDESSVTKDHLDEYAETSTDQDEKERELKNKFEHLLQHFVVDTVNERATFLHRRWFDDLQSYELKFTVAVDIQDAYPIIVYCLSDNNTANLTSLSAVMENDRGLSMEWKSSFIYKTWTAFYGNETTRMVESINNTQADTITIFANGSESGTDYFSWDELDEGDKAALHDCVELYHTLRAAKDEEVDLFHSR